MAAQTALDGVISELAYIKSLEPRVLNNAERSAWSHCLLSYNLTVNFLRNILDVKTKSKASDVQVRLSGASTNIFSCQDGFADVNETTNIYPLVVSNNVTELITNCLAVNKVLFEEEKRFRPKEFRKSFPANNSVFDDPDCVVAQDGSGNFTTVTEALEASTDREDVSQRYVIQVKQGTYEEYPVVRAEMKNIVLVGEEVYGDGFIAKDITFENTAGMDAGQAVAVLSQADQAVFYLCGFRGNQDTLYAETQRQFFRECEIYGTVDFIFGNANAVFQQSTIYPSNTDRGLVITAQGRSGLNESTGTVIQNCRIVPAPDFTQGGSPAYLGRPWKDYSTVVIMQSFLDSVVNPAGWMEWEGADPGRDSTVFYAEFDNSGPGSDTDERVQWPGYHNITDPDELEQYSIDNFIDGSSWLPDTGVPFDLF
ncbi:hypothetical protein ACET3Z_001320 [Daucus carota]